MISLEGLRSLMEYEVSFRQEVILAGMAVIAGLFLVYLKLEWFYFSSPGPEPCPCSYSGSP